MIDYEAANRKRDRILRRKLLTILDAAQTAPKGGINCRLLVCTVDEMLAPVNRFEGDEHAVKLLRNLESKELIVLKDERSRRSQAFTVEYLFARITAKGSSLLNETVSPDPDIDDERNLES